MNQHLNKPIGGNLVKGSRDLSVLSLQLFVNLKLFKNKKLIKTYLGYINRQQIHWSERLLILVNVEFGGGLTEKS